ncbi:hypothetical protein [Sphingobacterium daejeonense]|uniref:hypothetical protein n=1 Tax=Sphingobacterium daejeonense TaxID=371142 RepID=UPI003D312A05
MRKNISTLTIVFLGLMVGLFTASCEKNQQVAERDLNAGALAVLHIPTDAQGRIVPNASGNVLNLSASNTYLLDSVTRVPAGYTLNIPAGTTIQTGTARTYTVTNPLDPSEVETRSIAGVLVVEKGGKLNANGTATAPVVFTAASANPSAGDFGGIILLGNAPTNKPGTQEIEGLPKAPTAGGNTYGGTVANDNSGSLKYVRIEYPGIRLFENQEINGLTLGGVGSGTTLEHIQVSWSADDSFEFFGGTVNAKWLIANSGDDDDFDFDFGYSGKIQFAVGLKDPSSTHSTSGGTSDANGIESDNDNTGANPANTPITRPVLSNFTLLGYSSAATDLRNGNRWRRSSSLKIRNSVIAGFPGGSAFESVTSSGADFSYNVLHAFTSLYPPTGDTAPSYVSNVTTSKAATGVGTAIGLGTNPFYNSSSATPYNVNSARPTSTSTTSFAGTEYSSFFTPTTYKGAIAPSSVGANWLAESWVVL